MKSLIARIQPQLPLAGLLIAFVALALFYSIIIPIFEGPDEDAHFRYAKYIADQRAFPVQLFEPGGGVAGHQGWQPPLSYALAALVIAPLDTSDYEQHLWRNYAATFVGDPACCGRNIYYHPDSQNFPWTRTTLAVHLARLLSIFFGAVTVWTTYQIARIIFDQNSSDTNWSALATASIVAFNPSFLFASALVSNDAALAAFCALVSLWWVKLLANQFTSSMQSATMLGVAIGLALLVKTTALGLIPFSILVFLAVAWRKRDWRSAIINSVTMIVVIALVSGWWFVRNTLLYGDPLAYRLMLTSAIFPRAGPLTLPELFQISLPWLWQTFWGGPTPGDFSPAILIGLALLMVCALLGCVLFAIRNSPFAIRNSLLILGGWLAFILVAQIQFIRTTTGADQGRYLFPAIPAIALFFVIGLNEIVSGFKVKIGRSGSLAQWLIGSFFALALCVPFAYTLPAYARPALLSASDAQKISRPVNAVFADQIELLGYALEQRAVKPGETLRVTLDWRAHATMNESYRIFVHLVGTGNRIAGGADVIPARGAFPTVYWKPGDTFRDTVQIPIAAHATPGQYAITIGLYPVGKPDERLLITSSGDDHVIVDAIKVSPRDHFAYTPRTRVNANFGGQIDLSGYDLAVDQKTLHLVLYWRARTIIDNNYTVFLHVLDANGNIIDQVDRQPHQGNYPTSLWHAGEQVRDEYTLPLPADTRRIVIGLYNAATNERLPAGERDYVEIIVRGAGQ